jgi:DNA-binding NarL/FixJ family response regulator
MEPFMESYKIVLAEDHILLRQYIKKIIEENEQLTVVYEAVDGLELLELLNQSLPDMVIADISMPRLRGLQMTQKIKKLYPQIKVLILTMHKEKAYLNQAMLNGVDAYVLKQEMDQELFPAIQSVRAGNSYISPLLEANP